MLEKMVLLFYANIKVYTAFNCVVDTLTLCSLVKLLHCSIGVPVIETLIFETELLLAYTES